MKFFPGQRIKKVRGSPHLGLEAVYVGPGSDEEDRVYDMFVTILQPTTAKVTWLGYSLRIPADAGETLLAISENWEPVIPPGMKSIEEEGELWEPTQGEVTA